MTITPPTRTDTFVDKLARLLPVADQEPVLAWIARESEQLSDQERRRLMAAVLIYLRACPANCRQVVSNPEALAPGGWLSEWWLSLGRGDTALNPDVDPNTIAAIICGCLEEARGGKSRQLGFCCESCGLWRSAWDFNPSCPSCSSPAWCWALPEYNHRPWPWRKEWKLKLDREVLL